MRRGVSIYLVLIVLATVTSLVIAVANLVVFQSKYLAARSFSIEAYFGVEGGAEKGLYELSGFSSGHLTGVLGGVTYNVLFCVPGRTCSSSEIRNYYCDPAKAGSFCAIGIGTFKGTRRAIEILF